MVCAKTVITSAFVCLFLGSALASEEIRLVKPPKGAKIPGLKWSRAPLEVGEESSQNGKDTFSTVQLRGLFPTKDWNLIWRSAKVQINQKGIFELKIPLSGKLTRVDLIAIDPLGNIEKETIGILFKDYEAYRKQLAERSHRRHFFTGGLGITKLSYDQASRSVSCSSWALTGKLSYIYTLSHLWDLGLSGYGTLLPFGGTCTDPSGTSASMRFIGINARAGYTVPGIQDPWRLSIMVGIYYVTMLTSTGNFGFQNMAGPQLFPVLRRSLKNGDAIVTYLKFSPVSSGFSFLQLSNREIAGGGAYLFKLKNDHMMSLTFDVANLALEISGEAISSTSISFGFGYSF